MTDLVHGGLAAFNEGRFEDGGSNLYVNARGEIERIHRTELNGDGWPDIVVPNTHGHLERGPTRIFSAGGLAGPEATWAFSDLPNDSGWRSRIADVDGDGFLDLIVCNGENGVTSELPSYVYWGGPNGLTAERTILPTVGAYDVLAADVSGHGDGRLDLLMPSAWTDHHNPGRPRPIHAFMQVAPRQFEDQGLDLGVTSVAGLAIDGGSLRGDGTLDLAIANLYGEYDLDTDSFLWLGRPGGGFEPEPVRLPTRGASVVRMADLDGDGRPEVIFGGGDTVFIYWNRDGRVSAEDVTRLDVPGFETQFQRGAVGVAVADVDGDGRPELVLATRRGIEIRRADALAEVAQLLPLRFAIRVEAADLDGDRRPELLVSVYQDEATHDVPSRIYWNGPEGFGQNRWTPLPAAGAMGMTAADLDGDSRPEVVVNVTMQGPTSTWKDFPAFVYWGGPERAFAPDRRLAIPSGGEVYSYVIADVDCDGYADLVLARIFGLRIFRGGATGIRPDDWYELSIPDSVCMQVHVADLNRDGWLDLVAVVQTYDDRPETRAKSTRIFWGGPLGYSVERQSILETYSTGGAVLADVDDDGFIDLVVAEKNESLAIHHGGAGTGWPSGRVSRIPLGSRGHPSTVAVADLDGDGHLDLIVDIAGHYARSPESFVVLWGGPDGYSADRALRYDGGYTPGQLTVADIDGDGRLNSSCRRTRPRRRDGCRGKSTHSTVAYSAGSHAGSPVSARARSSRSTSTTMAASTCSSPTTVMTTSTPRRWSCTGTALTGSARTTSPGCRRWGRTISRSGTPTTPRSVAVERYTSPPLRLDGRRVTGIDWDADVPERTALTFEVRSAVSHGSLASEPWLELGDLPTAISFPAGTALVQYRASFTSRTAARSPRLRWVRIGLAQ